MRRRQGHMKTSVGQDTIQVMPLKEKGAQTGLALGAFASLQAVYEAPATPDLLHQTLSNTLTWQMRNESTVIKVILSPNLAPQFVAALLALGTRAIFGQETGLLANYLRRTLPHDDHLSTIYIPLDVPGRVWGEAHVARTLADEPIVSAMAVVDLTDGTVGGTCLALTGAWQEHARLAKSAELLVGGTLSQDRIQQVAAAVAQEVTPPDDFRGSADYRRAMAAVLTRRALEACRKAKENEEA
jgi:CO/xanthine dehydrogenase FAD-binding subunit